MFKMRVKYNNTIAHINKSFINWIEKKKIKFKVH